VLILHLLDLFPHFVRGITFDIQDVLSLTVLSMTVIQVVPIKINPWSAVGRWLGRVINADINSKVDKLSKSIDELKRQNDLINHTIGEDRAITARVRILRFGDEVSRGIKHSEENFEQVLSDIDMYEKYCASHPKFKNNQTVMTTKVIKETYEMRLKNRDFI
jgi:hypothetical protein